MLWKIFLLFISVINPVNLVSLLLNGMKFSGIFLLFLVSLFFFILLLVDSGWRWLTSWSTVK